MTTAAIIIFCTCPNQASAEKIAENVVQAKLAACVNLIPNITSVYIWQDKLEKSQEILLIIKTLASLYPAVEEKIVADHPYDCPEVISMSIENAKRGYLQWIENSVLN